MVKAIVFPNPSKDAVNVTFESNENRHIKIEIYSITGVLIQTLLDDEIISFRNCTTIFNKNGELASGLYLCKISFGEQYIVKRIILSE
ncbi:T9SS type A sorting domain-containing protein [Aquimarina spongiae]|uniref:T9SS type A sorting domain-containing protein n=1 Tax=Aquimarina spongiae TaxID=570521 RepID=UPI000A0408CC